MGSKVLIVDEDPWARRMIRVMLQRNGHVADFLPSSQWKSAAKLAAKISANPPDLLIMDVALQTISGWAALEQIRKSVPRATLPILVISGFSHAEDVEKCKTLGATAFIGKPFRVEELHRMVDAILCEYGQANVGVEFADHVGFLGQLHHIGVSSLLSLIEIEKMTGVLIVETKIPDIPKSEQARGHIFLRDGRVIAASIEKNIHQKPLEGDTAVYQILTWTQGNFEFDAMDVTVVEEIKSSTTHLLMEGARRVDEGEISQLIKIDPPTEIEDLDDVVFFDDDDVTRT